MRRPNDPPLRTSIFFFAVNVKGSHFMLQKVLPLQTSPLVAKTLGESYRAGRTAWLEGAEGLTAALRARLLSGCNPATRPFVHAARVSWDCCCPDHLRESG